MKKVLSMILVLVMVFSLTGCLPSPDEVGGGVNVDTSVNPVAENEFFAEVQTPDTVKAAA